MLLILYSNFAWSLQSFQIVLYLCHLMCWFGLVGNDCHLDSHSVMILPSQTFFLFEDIQIVRFLWLLCQIIFRSNVSKYVLLQPHLFLLWILFNNATILEFVKLEDSRFYNHSLTNLLNLTNCSIQRIGTIFVILENNKTHCRSSNGCGLNQYELLQEQCWNHTALAGLALEHILVLKVRTIIGTRKITF